jgi:hypothetical protein
LQLELAEEIFEGFLNNFNSKIKPQLKEMTNYMDDVEEKKRWSTSRVIDETVNDLYNVKNKDGFRIYLKYAKWYIYRLPLYNSPPPFGIRNDDLSTRVKKRACTLFK